MLVRVERMVAGGDALARQDDGKIVFVPGALPGEQVAVELTDSKKDFGRGALVEVAERSGDRVEPPCEHRRAGCGGCDWQHVAIDAQLGAKVGIVRDALRRTAKLDDADVRAGAAVAPDGYRTTIRVVGDADGRAAYRKADSNDTVAIDHCLVAHPNLRSIVPHLRLPPGAELTLRTSAATGQLTALWDRERGDVAGLPDDVHAGPRAHLVERVAGHDLRVSAGSFFQSGPAAAELLVDAVGRAAPELADAATVLDAYAGVGLFAATLTGNEVATVESSTSSVADCEANLAGRRSRVFRSEVARWQPDTAFDAVIADPARPGLGKPGVATLAAAAAPVFVLVSCDPVSLARDTRLLADAGYRHAGSEVLDLFPHTHHVETVTRFERGGA